MLMYSSSVARFDGDSVPSRDAAVGLGLIADALDRGFDTLDRPARRRFWLGDAIAIGLGWLLLVAVIFYPALQLLAIGGGIAYLGAKPLLRLVLGTDMAQVPRHGTGAPRSRNDLLAA